MNVSLNIVAKNGDHVQDPYGECIVTLSRRNLLSLIHKMDRPDPEEGIVIRTLSRMTEGGLLLTVVAEDDREHYDGREAGQMGSDIEAKIASEERDRLEHEDALSRFDAGE